MSTKTDNMNDRVKNNEVNNKSIKSVNKKNTPVDLRTLFYRLFNKCNLSCYDAHAEYKISGQSELPPEKNIYILDEKFYEQVLSQGSLGLGESYMEGKWVTHDLLKVLRALVGYSEFQLLYEFGWSFFLTSPKAVITLVSRSLKSLVLKQVINLQNFILSKRVAKEHYDLPCILYEKMLDPWMQYSCAYWGQQVTEMQETSSKTSEISEQKQIAIKVTDSALYPKLSSATGIPTVGARDLNEAQLMKLNLIVSKLHITDGMTILDCGSGYGSCAAFLAERFPKSKILAISISEEQVKYAKAKYSSLKNVTYLCMDYREPELETLWTPATGFDRIYSVGALEHFGTANYPNFFRLVYRLLSKEGIFLLHCITAHHESWIPDGFMDKHIFPGGELSSVGRLVSVGEQTDLICEDLHRFGLDYAKTLEAWTERFDLAWSNLVEYDPTFFTPSFYRKWTYYLFASRALFLERILDLSQIVYTKKRYLNYNRLS